METSAPAIVVEELVKTFRIAERRPGLWGAITGLVRRRMRLVRALDGVSFTIAPGEIVGYVGPNGAGKSTTVKILSGILRPDSGTCTVLGRTPWEDRREHVRRIGVVFGQRSQLWWDLPVVESFDLLRDIYGTPPGEEVATRHELVELLGLGPLLDVPVRQLSLGQRMRCELAASLLHRPAVLFLDEPTIGLDAAARLEVRQLIARASRERQATVILTTHDMDDIEALCSRVMVMGEGRLLFDGSLDRLRGRVPVDRRLILDLASEPGELPLDPDLVLERREGLRLHYRFDPRRIPAASVIARVTARLPVRDLAVHEAPIEELVARLWSTGPS